MKIHSKKHQPLLIEGLLQLKGRFGFVLSEDPKLPDIYVTGPSLKLAMNGDRVAVRLGPGKRREGVITKVLKRARSTVVGTLKKENGHAIVIPQDAAIAPLRLVHLHNIPVQEGQVVVAKILHWPTLEQSASGELQEVLGWPTDPGVDVQTILRENELPEKFPSAVLKEVEHLGKSVSPSAWAGRTSFFHTPVFTIDGKDAKDFDDAVSLEPLTGGLVRLGVHIADVSHYVRLGTALDQEALRRATSIYLVDRVIPMLPKILSEELCSLNPQVERLTLSCLMDIDSQGQVRDYKIVESVIKSARRFTYEDVEDILRAGQASDAVGKTVLEMGKLARILRQKRFARGSLDFDFPETKVVLDAHGKPVRIVPVQRLESHKLIEEFMLLANETVAGHMHAKKIPCLYRIHETPDKGKLEKMIATLRVFGVSIPPKFSEGSHKAFGTVLAFLHGKPYEDILDKMLLRTLKQAVYSVKNVGHYGLASPCYTHFTSPIRRYPDLCVHRMLKFRAHGQPNGAQTTWEHTLPKIAPHASEQERLAQAAEWESQDLKKVQFMQDKVGETFVGVISSVTNFGFFVELIEFQVEGLVRMDSLGDDYYIFDETRLLLRGRRTHKTFHPGQEVRVLLAAANEAKRQLDFQLVTKK